MAAYLNGAAAMDCGHLHNPWPDDCLHCNIRQFLTTGQGVFQLHQANVTQLLEAGARVQAAETHAALAVSRLDETTKKMGAAHERQKAHYQSELDRHQLTINQLQDKIGALENRGVNDPSAELAKALATVDEQAATIAGLKANLALHDSTAESVQQERDDAWDTYSNSPLFERLASQTHWLTFDSLLVNGSDRERQQVSDVLAGMMTARVVSESPSTDGQHAYQLTGWARKRWNETQAKATT